MNVEPITRHQLEDVLPRNVWATGDSGVYWVGSVTRRTLRHRVDVSMLQCSCESATFGQSRRAALRSGGVVKYESFCGHLRRAVAYDGMLLRWLLEQAKGKK